MDTRQALSFKHNFESKLYKTGGWKKQAVVKKKKKKDRTSCNKIKIGCQVMTINLNLHSAHEQFL